jgi:nicotinamide mononucleotide (NMN) deamidase PncC
MSEPTFEELVPDDASTISDIQRLATKKGYELLKLINSKAKWGDKTKGEVHRCGLIMSTLVDIPWAGFAKYGGFGVYDPDAKKVFNRVSVDDVYTHKCAAEMAIGVLKNSNATLAIAVTGNAMPLNVDVDKLGEVFIGIAGYNNEGKIIYVTTVLNMCTDDENTYDSFKKTCKDWYEKIKGKEGEFNERTKTATISKEIRYYTAYKAYQQCISFIENHDPSVPEAIIKRKEQNESTTMSERNKIHTNIPADKYTDGGNGICVNVYPRCEDITGNRETEKTAEYKVPSIGGGKNSKNKKKNKRSFRLRSTKRRH